MATAHFITAPIRCRTHRAVSGLSCLLQAFGDPDASCEAPQSDATLGHELERSNMAGVNFSTAGVSYVGVWQSPRIDEMLHFVRHPRREECRIEGCNQVD